MYFYIGGVDLSVYALYNNEVVKFNRTFDTQFFRIRVNVFEYFNYQTLKNLKNVLTVSQ